MYTRIIFNSILFLLMATSGLTQQIDGFWYSSDSSRLYTIRTFPGGMEAILSSSSRSGDTTGVIVIKAKKNKTGKYSGLITTSFGDMATRVKIRCEKDQILQLKLRRMFIFPVRIRWYRTSDKNS